ncbi:MAG: hypothetical protein ACKVY0_15190 [Prosthecobacter sp.]|uniref:hypothetical protein n=1 Tax=Prosthecobacter sp. TaxID=1965333 RepID=UPI003902C79A
MSSPAFLSEPRVSVVGSFAELIATPFSDGVNALCWPRTLVGDFAEVVARLGLGQGITTLDAGMLRALPLSAAGKAAVEAMLADHHLLTEQGLEPVLNGINGYVQPEETGPVRTDVCSFHVDSATAEVDTWLCTYHGASSEGLPNEQAIRRVDVPGTRALLLKVYGGADDEGFHEWMNDHYYDLHYAPLPDAKPYSFGIGCLWRVATLHDGCPVPPCIHRAPDPVRGQQRLLLIS